VKGPRTNQTSSSDSLGRLDGRSSCRRILHYCNCTSLLSEGVFRCSLNIDTHTVTRHPHLSAFRTTLMANGNGNGVRNETASRARLDYDFERNDDYYCRSHTNDLHQKMLGQRSLGCCLELDARSVFPMLGARFTARHTIAKSLGFCTFSLTSHGNFDTWTMYVFDKGFSYPTLLPSGYSRPWAWLLDRKDYLP